MGAWADVAIATSAKHKGEGLAVRCTAGSSFLLREGMEVAFVPSVLDAPRRGVVSSVSGANGMRATVAFEGFSPEDAEALEGCHILARRDDFGNGEIEGAGPLFGFEVHDASEGFVGNVVGLVDNPAQALLEVERADGAIVLVPVVDEFIAGIDEDASRIDIDAPAGLLDL